MKDNKKKKKPSDTLNKIVISGKKLSDDFKNTFILISEKAKQEIHTRKMKKYNPLFPEQYKNENFSLPNIIVIVDDAIRRDIDVCAGAIGWRTTENNSEILYLYDEFIADCELDFIPAVTCNSVYCVDNFNRKRFIRSDCIFAKAHEEKLAELEHIAYSLGAKSCSVEIAESYYAMEEEKKSVSETVAKCSSSGEKNASHKNTTQRSGKTTTYFDGNSTPVIPELKWFAHDDNIKRLIEMRCSEQRTVKSKTLILEGSSSATLSQETAYNIDCVIGKINSKSKVSMEKQSAQESNSKLIFIVEF